MIKAMIFLKRREEMTLEGFKSWWLEQHRFLADNLPGLRRHTFNLMSDGPFDAVVEQWFDSQYDLTTSYGTEVGDRVVADSRRHVSVRQRVIVEEFDFDISGRGDLDR